MFGLIDLFGLNTRQGVRVKPKVKGNLIPAEFYKALYTQYPKYIRRGRATATWPYYAKQARLHDESK